MGRVRFMVLSSHFYNTLYECTPGTLRRDTAGLSAVCLLPPKVKLDRPQTAVIATRRETPAGPPYGRSGISDTIVHRPHTVRAPRDLGLTQGTDRALQIGQSALDAARRPKTVVHAQMKGMHGTQRNKARPHTASKVTEADSFEEKVMYYRQQPISTSR